MTDDDSTPDQGQPSLYYDFFKWITTLSLVAIGGVFSLVTQAEFKFKSLDLLIILIALGLAATTGLVAAELQVRGAKDPVKLRRTNKRLSDVAVFLLGSGAGYFVLAFANQLMK